ncbi:MAG: cell division protein FtsZ [Flavobacteriales bacterium]|jgi:cell division protein FtsZ
MDDNSTDMMRFNLPKDYSSIIKVIGVGGGGSNAVNYMYEQGIKGVDFIVCNTDEQALDNSPVPLKIQLGATLTEGRGAGSIPEVGKNAAVETLEEIKELLATNTTMVFVTAGMGGGTGTGAAPIIARAAKELGILTVGIVTVPFNFEGRKRMTQAEIGLQEMRDAVDTLLIIRNDKLRELYGNLTLKGAFSHADEVLCTAAKGIAEVITLTGEINVDMNDVNTVMRSSGVAIMGSGRAQGENRAMRAVTQALESPLLNDNDIQGANFVLLNITYGAEDVLMDEIMEITDHIQEKAGMSAEVIWGYGPDSSLEEDLCVTVIATGFQSHEVDAGLPKEAPKKEIYVLGQDELKEITNKVTKPTQSNQVAESNVDVAPAAIEEPYLIRKEEPAEMEEATEEITSAADTIDLEEAAELEEMKLIIQNEALAETESNKEDLSTSEDEPSANGELNVKDDQPQEAEAPLNFDLQPNLFGVPVEEESTFKNEFDNKSDEAPEKESSAPLAQEESSIKYYNLDADVLDNAAEAPELGDLQISTDENPGFEERPSREKLVARNREREVTIKDLTLKLKTPSGLADLESEPAYRRRNVQLDDTPTSDQSKVSRFTLSEEIDENGRKEIKLKDNNPFLHDNVD